MCQSNSCDSTCGREAPFTPEEIAGLARYVVEGDSFATMRVIVCLNPYCQVDHRHFAQITDVFQAIDAAMELGNRYDRPMDWATLTYAPQWRLPAVDDRAAVDAALKPTPAELLFGNQGEPPVSRGPHRA